jgi:hypothetical protein
MNAGEIGSLHAGNGNDSFGKRGAHGARASRPVAHARASTLLARVLTSRPALAGVFAVTILCCGCRYLREGDFAEREAAAQEAQTKQRQQALEAQPGRWVVVNPTPQFVSNTLLLDTATGDTWARCALGQEDAEFFPTEGNIGWCGKLQRKTYSSDEIRAAVLDARVRRGATAGPAAVPALPPTPP